MKKSPFGAKLKDSRDTGGIVVLTKERQFCCLVNDCSVCWESTSLKECSGEVDVNGDICAQQKRGDAQRRKKFSRDKLYRTAVPCFKTALCLEVHIRLSMHTAQQ